MCIYIDILGVRIEKTTINSQFTVSRFCDYQVNKRMLSFTRIFLYWNMKTFILIDQRTKRNINISFNHYHQSFHIDTVKLAVTFYLRVRSDLDTRVRLTSCDIKSIALLCFCMVEQFELFPTLMLVLPFFYALLFKHN